MGLNLGDFSDKLHSEVEKYSQSHPGKNETVALEKFYIRFKDGAIVVEKKSLLTKVWNFFSKTRRAEYDFEANFTKIAEEFSKAVKSESQDQRLTSLAKELNTVLDHVNAKRQEKGKERYDLKKLTITHISSTEPSSDESGTAQALQSTNAQRPVRESLAMDAKAALPDKNPAPTTSINSATPATSQPGKLRKDQMPNEEQQRAMMEGISGGKVFVSNVPVEQSSGVAGASAADSGSARNVRELPRKKQGQRPIGKREVFLRQHQKQEPSQPATNPQPVVQSTQIASAATKGGDLAGLREVFKNHQELFERCLGEEISEVFDGEEIDLIEKLADYLDSSVQEIFSDRMRALEGSWLGGYTSYDYAGTLAYQLREDINEHFTDLIDEVYAIQREKQGLGELTATLNKMVNLFERAECLLEAHDAESDKNKQAQYSKALLLAEKLFSAVDEEYKDRQILLDNLQILIGCKKTVEPYFVKKRWLYE